jgi:hypothetical protein
MSTPPVQIARPTPEGNCQDLLDLKKYYLIQFGSDVENLQLLRLIRTKWAPQ